MHYIKKRSKKNFFNSEIIVGDIETQIVNNKHQIKLLILFDGLTFFSFHSLPEHLIIQQFILCLQQKKLTTVFFHNLSKFDGYLILKQLLVLKEKINIIFQNNAIYRITLLPSKINLRDSLLIIPMSLQEMSQKLLKKKKIDFDFTKLHFFEKNFNEIYYYCQQDCILLYECLIQCQKQFKQETGLDLLLKITLPAFAMTYFLHAFYSINTLEIVDLQKDTWLRNAYFGGYVDVYYNFGRQLYHYDINSLYPFCMTKILPIGAGIFLPAKKINLNTFFGFIHCEIKTTNMINKMYPFLVQRSKEGILTPIGSWTGTYFSEELKLAQSVGYQIKILTGIEFQQGAPLRNYIKTLYSNRVQTIKSIQNFFYKMLMNSIYGKFGTQPNVTKMLAFHNENEKIHFETVNEILQEIELNGSYLVKYKPSKNYNLILNLISNVALAAAITAYGRIEIYKYKILKNNNCFYTDTDSIFLQKPIETKYVSHKIGLLKLEGFIQRAYFLAPKIYAYWCNNIFQIKFTGLEQKETKQLTEITFQNILNVKKKYKNNTLKIINIFQKQVKTLEIVIQKIEKTFKIINQKRIQKTKKNIQVYTIPQKKKQKNV